MSGWSVSTGTTNTARHLCRLNDARGLLGRFFLIYQLVVFFLGKIAKTLVC